MESTHTSGGWYAGLVQSANALAEELELNDTSTKRLRDYVFEKTKEHFMAGNRSGIIWARKNPPTGRYAQAAA